MVEADALRRVIDRMDMLRAGLERGINEGALIRISLEEADVIVKVLYHLSGYVKKQVEELADDIKTGDEGELFEEEYTAYCAACFVLTEKPKPEYRPSYFDLEDSEE